MLLSIPYFFPFKVKEEEEKELINVGYQKWKEAVENCNTISRMHVLLGILDACIKWEKSAENAVSEFFIIFIFMTVTHKR